MHKNTVLHSQVSEDHSEKSDQDNDSDESVEQCFIPRVDRNLNYEVDFSRIILNVACNHLTIQLPVTNYPVVREVAGSLGMQVVDERQEPNWDICWTDHPITPQTFIRMHFHQSINYLPGIHTIARKNELGIRLNLMNKVEPDQYNFYPRTWMLPDQFPQLRRFMESTGKGEIFIVKPEANCQGRGIYLASRLEDILIGNHCVVQRYVDNPLLLEGYKFDLRVYVLIGSIDPLRIYLYHDGLARFATETYEYATRSNFKSAYQHLTNYAINKLNPKFKEKQSGGQGDCGFKRSIKAVMKNLAQQQIDTNKIWKKIEEIAIKSVFLGYEKMRHNYVSCQPEEYHNRMAFHIIGLDILIDDHYEPFLLEVNHTPSFATETLLDQKIKTSLIRDTLSLLRLNDLKLKQELFHKAKICSNNRIEQGRRQSYNSQIRQRQLQNQIKLREDYEINVKSGYHLIFPTQETQRSEIYKQIIVKVKRTLHKKVASSKKTKKPQILKGKEAEKQKYKDFKQMRAKQHENVAPFRDKKVETDKIKSHSIYTQRVRDEWHQSLFQTVKKDLSSLPHSLVNKSIAIQNHRNRTFTIKTKLSIPEVVRRPSIKAFELQHKQQKKDKVINKYEQKVGSFLKPKTYDVPALMITSFIPDQQRVVRKKNREGKFIFHISKS